MTKIEKTAVCLSIGIIIVLIFLIGFSDHGLLDYKRLKDQETLVLKQVQTTRIENRQLENEVQSLKTDIEYIKHIAKHEHDMAEPGELIFKDQSGQTRQKGTPKP